VTGIHDNGPQRVGVVGCGAIAANHVEAYAALAGVEVVGCCDVDEERARRFAADHGIAPAAGLAQLAERGATLVSVCTPHPTHEAVVLEAAALGLHVQCEKPIAIDLAAAQRMVSACEQAGVTLGVSFQRRHWPAARRIREAIDDGRLGDPVLAHVSVLLHRDSSYYTKDPWRGSWKSDGGGVLMTQAVHNLDLLTWYLGEPVSASARWAQFRHGEVIEVEDTLVGHVAFASGALATISASTALAPGLGTHLLVVGSTGACVGLREYPEGAIAVNDLWTLPGQEAMSGPSGLLPDPDLATVNGSLKPFHALHLADFVEAVRTGRTPAVSGADALRSLSLVLALYESARTGTTVSIPSITTHCQETT